MALEGRIERYRQAIHPERSEPVSEAISTVRTRHTNELAQLAGEGRDAVRRRGAREVRALLYEDRLRLRVGYVELITGMMLEDLDEVVRNRQAWTSAAQAQRAGQRQHQADLDSAPERPGPARSDSAR